MQGDATQLRGVTFTMQGDATQLRGVTFTMRGDATQLRGVTFTMQGDAIIEKSINRLLNLQKGLGCLLPHVEYE